MLEEDGKYYLYRHIRLDTNQPFYVGIGTKYSVGNTTLSVYKRAYDTHQRSPHWMHIKNKAGYKVDIIIESNCYNFIQDKEREYIYLYGRSFEGGLLCNIEGGGNRCKDKDFLGKKVFCCNDRIWFDTLTKASAYYNIDRGSLIKNTKDILPHANNYVFSLNECDCVKIDKINYKLNEVWSDIPGYENLYKVSNYGRIIRVSYNIIDNFGCVIRYKEKLISSVLRTDNKQVSLSKGNKYTTQSVKKLVYCTFNKINIKERLNIININGDYHDCRLSNLEAHVYINKNKVLL